MTDHAALRRLIEERLKDTRPAASYETALPVGIASAVDPVIRQFFPAEEAGWRVPVWFFSNICGMALGGWLAARRKG